MNYQILYVNVAQFHLGRNKIWGLGALETGKFQNAVIRSERSLVF